MSEDDIPMTRERELLIKKLYFIWGVVYFLRFVPGDGPRRGVLRLNRSFELMAPDCTLARACQEPFCISTNSMTEWRTGLEWKNAVVVSAGGALGALARYGVSLWANARFETPFPVGTFTINMSGSFAIGLIAAFSMGFAWNEQARLFIAMGFLGAFTTFSTFEYETLLLLMNGKRMGIALGYVAASIIVGLGAVALGFALGKAVAGSRMPAA